MLHEVCCDSDPSYSSAFTVPRGCFQGLCEVVVYNRGLASPVLTLFTRLLRATLDEALSKKKINLQPVEGDGATGGVLKVPNGFTGVPLRLSKLITADSGSSDDDSGLRYQDHPVKRLLHSNSSIIVVP